jgi:hypothetical protein
MLDDTPIADLNEVHGQWVIERPSADHQTIMATIKPRHNQRQRARALIWHRRMGHPGPSALEHLVQHSEGVKITGILTIDCDACGRAKSRKLISRVPRTIEEAPGERISLDFHDYEADSSTKERSQMLITDRVTGFMWDYYFKDNRTARSIIRVLESFVTLMKTQFNIVVKIIETDNEIVTVKPEVARWAENRGIRIEASAPDTQSQNGGAERSGGVIKEKARAMRLDANLPWPLWPEIVRTAVYLNNRTPRYSNRWRSPYEEFFTHNAYRNGIVTSPRKPNQGHLRAYGCKAFAMTDDTKRGKSRLQRLDPKAWIGYLVGYRSSNIFRIWVPTMAKVITTRDVVFDEDSIFTGDEKDIMDNLMHSTLEEIEVWIRTVELPPGTQEQEETQSFLEDLSVQEGPRRENPVYDETGRKVRMAYPSPPLTPPPVALLTNLMSAVEPRQTQYAETLLGTQSRTVLRQLSNHGTDHPLSSSCSERPSGTCRANIGSRPVDIDIGSGAVGESFLHNQRAPWAEAFMAGEKGGKILQLNGNRLDSAAVERIMIGKGKMPHLDELPPAPSPNQLRENHLFYRLFKKAEEEHLASHKQSKSWSETPMQEARLTNSQVLDSMWVYTYKLDKEHHFIKCKARLVVRGDQQRNVTTQETYAATLASRSFRMALAIAARFDLELKQFDVTNAFVHALIDRIVYMRMPRGYSIPGKILRLNKALYGLRISPLLWQRDFTSYLRSEGFSAVPHEPCCMIRKGVFVFFYVDDIIVMYSKNRETEAQLVVEVMKQKYSITGGKDLQWFLGMELIRDRSQRKVWLSQTAYISKIQRLVSDRSIKSNTPMVKGELLPREGFATPSEINLYQRKIGSLLFAAVNTRPDTAFAVSRLARFLTNPGAEHQSAADRVLLYLEQTRTLSLQLGGEDHLVVASDASFADNTLDRKSSQGYIIKLFGGLIAWRANKQNTVTTSTTEAELLSVSQVAKEAMFTRMLLTELRVQLADPTITIQCDNKQTIRLISEEISQLTTKLRHVDIHNHWLRQEAERQSIKVVYVESNQMLADGLTKALPASQWARFLQQMGLMEVKERPRQTVDLGFIEAKLKATELQV